jgi:hypothetical protein
MDQYNQPPLSNEPLARHNMTPARVESSNSGSSHESSHLASLVHRLMETVDKQSRQIQRLESTISEVRATIRNRSE